MCHVAAEILTDDDVPCRAMASVKLLLNLSSNILLDVVFFEGGGGNVNALLLHLIAHVDVFYDGLGAYASRSAVSDGAYVDAFRFLGHWWWMEECNGVWDAVGARMSGRRISTVMFI